jgi:hypothetical protein
MAVVSRMFNGSTFSFASAAVGKLIGIAFKQGGAWIDVTEPEDANKLFEQGQTEIDVQLRFKGGAAGSLTHKAKGVAAIVWKDGSTTTCPGTWMVGPKSVEGSWDAPISSTVELRPTVPDTT